MIGAKVSSQASCNLGLESWNLVIHRNMSQLLEVWKRCKNTLEAPFEVLNASDLLQSDAAISVTAGALGVNINDRNAVQQWLSTPVASAASNQQVFEMVRACHENVIRPEYYSLVTQLESGLKAVNDGVFRVRKEVAWMIADNRLQQKYACGT